MPVEHPQQTNHCHRRKHSSYFTSSVTITPNTGVTAGTSCSAPPRQRMHSWCCDTHLYWTLNGLPQSGDTYVVDTQTAVGDLIECVATV